MKRTGQFCMGFLMVNLLWLAGAALIHSRALPGPLIVYVHIGDVVSAGIFRHTFASLGRIMAGLGLSAALGVPAGIAMALSPGWNRILHPLVYFSYPVPKTALLPVAMLLLGMGEGSKIMILTLTLIFQITVTVRDAVRGTDPALYHVAISAGMGRRAILRHVTLPSILPALLTSLRIGMGTALAVLFIVEAYGTRAGLGYYILDAWSRIDYTEMYGGIAAISLLGVALFMALDWLAGRLCPWITAQ